MDRQTKLRILADSAKYDASCASSGSVRQGTADGIGNSDGTGICHSYTPDGRCVSLLKILLTNYCVYDCLFCVNRVSSDIPRAAFSPEEVVELTLDFYRRNYIEGLFLSSGIAGGPDGTMEKLVRVARTLRLEHKFNGYIHLKVIPGASAELIDEAGRYADRISANIELPTQRDLSALAPEKNTKVIESTMSHIRARRDETRSETSRNAPRFAPAGQSTQMIVGATPTTDRAILTTADRLYQGQNLKRIYYTAFSPFPKADARLPLSPPDLVRENRLYQADWLMRYYGFQADELTTDAAPNLDLSMDPKMSWALRHPFFFPVDVNLAPRESLLRVPGFGRKTVERILTIRRQHRISFADLRKLRVPVERARAFVRTADRAEQIAVPAPAAIQQPAQQIALFTEEPG